MKKNKQLVPLILVVAAILGIAIAVFLVKGSIEQYSSAASRVTDSRDNLQKLQLEDKRISEEQEKDALELSSIKPVYKASQNSAGDTLAIFGPMFEQVIQLSRESGLLIRSIQYQMNPTDDQVYTDFGNEYNVCELKFFFVGTYIQLKDFLYALVNRYEYLVSISKLNVSSFKSNPDYVLINISITLYSKKPTGK